MSRSCEFQMTFHQTINLLMKNIMQLFVFIFYHVSLSLIRLREIYMRTIYVLVLNLLVKKIYRKVYFITDNNNKTHFFDRGLICL